MRLGIRLRLIRSASISQRLDLRLLHAPGSGLPRAWYGLQCPSLLTPQLSAERVTTLRHLVDQHNCDLFISSSTYYSTQRRLVCFVRVTSSFEVWEPNQPSPQDMDSCLLANECIDEMAYVNGKGPEVAEITRKYAQLDLRRRLIHRT